MPRTFFLLLTLCLFTACSGATRETNAPVKGQPFEKQPKPNVIYILADDLGYGDLGSYGQQVIATPNLDRLASNGLRFTDHYAGSTVCAPSRCVLMTGKHVGTCYTRGNYHDKQTGYTHQIPGGEPALPWMMKNAGYATACVGKWGLGPPDSESDPNSFGFDFFYGFLDQRHAHNHYPDVLWRNKTLEKTGNIMTQESRVDALGTGVAVKRVAYANDLFFKESRQWIDTQAKIGRPFFLYLALTVPHANNEAGRLLEHMPEENREQRGQEVPDLGRYADKDWHGPNKGTAAMITRFDKQIGDIVKQLETLGIADDTLILFTSDNGPHAEGGNRPDFFNSNGPLRGIKRDLYDGGIRVPLIAYWPGTVRPGTTGHVSAFHDVLPTLADLANIPDNIMPAGINGISFAPTLLGDADQPEHDYLYWEFFEQQGKQAVRMGKWKAIRLKVHKDKDGPIQLYDITADPGEQDDLADQHPDVVKQMSQIMQTARTRSDVPQYRFDWEQ